MIKRNTVLNPNYTLHALSFLVVTILFHICYGLEVLIPTNISWLLTVKHDWGGHYLGWYFYRTDAWHFPLGDMHNLMYPMGTNIGFSDSTPLMALPLKLLSGILPEDFQYFGFWLYLSHLLAGFFTIKLFNRFGVKPIYTFLAVVFVAANPVLVYRGLHPSLTAQWLLLACIYIYFLDPTTTSPRKVLLYQFVLVLLSALIHPYLCFMVLGFTFFTALKLWKADKSISISIFFGYQAVSVFSLLVLWYLVGMIILGEGEDLSVQGAYGLYGLNLNSLHNTFGFSSFLPQLDWVSDHQYEGYAYLGVGMMILVLLAIVYTISQKLFLRDASIRSSIRIQQVSLWPLGILLLLYVLFAITHVVTYGNKVLFTVPIPQKIIEFGGIFRASSRFFWVVYYIIFIFTISIIANSSIKNIFKLTIISLALAVQLYDTKLILTFRDLTYGAYNPPIDTERWLNLMQEFDQVVMYPGYETNNLTPMDYQYFSFLAARARKPINTGYIPRVNSKKLFFLVDSLKNDLENGQLAANALYITTRKHLNSFSLPLQLGKAEVANLDNYYVVYSSLRQDPVLSNFIKNSTPLDSAILDSMKAATKKRYEFKEVSNSIISSGKPIKYALEKVFEGEKFISLSGWAFIESADNNKGDSLYFFLKSDKKTYLSKVPVFARPDVTSFFKKSYLDDAGFKDYIFTSNVLRGQYNLGIAIKDKLGNWHYQLTDKRVSVNKLDYSSPAMLPTKTIAADINFNIEEVKETSNAVQVNGWAFMKNVNALESQVYVALINDSKSFMFQVDQIQRPDVTAYFNSKENYDNSGFTVKFLKAALPKGKYKIGVYLKNTSTSKEGVMLSEKEVTL